MPLLLVLLSLALTTVAGAQSTAPAAVTVRGTPGGVTIAELPRGAPLRTGPTRNGWTQVTVEGWVASTRLGTRRDTLDRVVNDQAATAPLRAKDGPRQAVVATLTEGTYLRRVQERNGWTRVRRSGWVRAEELQPAKVVPASRNAAKAEPARGDAGRTPPKAATPAAKASPAPAAATPAAAPPTARGAAVTPKAPLQAQSVERTVRASSLRSAPNGAERARVPAGALVETLGREQGWVRVRIEGWVPESDLGVADTAAVSRLSAADLRADPERYRGAVVRWTMTHVALQKADGLRKGMAANETYLLLRGPGDDPSLVYAVVPPSLVEVARGLGPMTKVIVTVRVREGRSEPTGVPIVDLMTLAPAR
jgi:pyruvate/2-oxoglutarate dehydrogenase complex dihydrolipoamide acyltransferase (E2) component